MSGDEKTQAKMIKSESALLANQEGKTHLKLNSNKTHYAPEDFKILLENVAKGDAGSQYILAEFYANPCSDKYDPQKAFKLFEKVEQNGQSPAEIKFQAIHQLGLCYLKGKDKGVSRNINKALEYLKLAAKNKVIDAMRDLGWIYKEGKVYNIPEDEDKSNKYYAAAFQGYLQLAEAGDAWAQYNVARMYKRGYGCIQSDESSIEWYKKAINHTHPFPAALNNLGWLYKEHRVKEGYVDNDTDNKIALELFKRASELNHPLAQFNLAVMHLKGIATPQNINEAERLLKNITTKWNIIIDPISLFTADGKYTIAYAYYRGLGTLKQNFAEAVKWLKQAENEKEDADVSYLLGRIFEFDLKDNAEAQKHYRQAEKLGHVKAKEALDSFGRFKTFFEKNSQASRLHAFAFAGDKENLIKLSKSEHKNYSEVETEKNNGKTPLYIAIENNQLDIVECLINKIKVRLDQTDKRGNTPFHRAVIRDNEQLVNLFLQKINSDPDICFITNNKGLTPIELAFKKNKNCKKLLSQFATDSSHTFLHLAANKGYIEFIEMLARYKVLESLIGKNDSEGNTALHIAVISGNPKCAEYLIQHGEKINQKNDQGKTPLMLAAEKGDLEMVSKLIELGADILCSDDEFNTAIEIAANAKHSSVLRHLLKSRPSFSEKYINEVLNQYQSEYNRDDPQANKQLRYKLLSSILHENMTKIEKRTLKLQLLSQWAGINGTEKTEHGMEKFENWCAEDFLSIMIFYLCEIIMEIEVGEFQEAKLAPYIKADVINRLKKEVCYELEALRERRDALLIYNKFRYNGEMTSPIIENKLAQIKHLSPGDSPFSNAGYNGHSVYVTFKTHDNDLILIIDDLGIACEKYHTSITAAAPEENLYYPFVAKMSLQKGYEDKIKDYLTQLITVRFSSPEQSIAAIYEVEQHGFRKLSPEELKEYPLAKLQTMPNCVVENFKLGFKSRLTANKDIGFYNSVLRHIGQEYLEHTIIGDSVADIKPIKLSMPLQLQTSNEGNVSVRKMASEGDGGKNEPLAGADSQADNIDQGKLLAKFGINGQISQRSEQRQQSQINAENESLIDNTPSIKG